MTVSMKDWTQADTRLALSEGWMVFNDCEIQRDDEAGKFESDDDAIAHVRRRAQEGSSTHQRALAIHEAGL